MRSDLLMVGVSLAAALTLTLGSAQVSEDHATHDGTVMSAALGKLVLLEQAGKQETYSVPDSVPIMIMGKQAKLEELKPGLQVRVTLGKKGEVAAITTVGPVKIVGDFPKVY